MSATPTRPRGLYFEEFETGMRITTPGRTITESDIVRSCAANGGRGLEALSVVDVMTADPLVADVSDDVGSRLEVMLESGVGCLPVVEDGRHLGVLYLPDLLEHRIEALMEELGMLHEYVASLQEAILD